MFKERLNFLIEFFSFAAFLVHVLIFFFHPALVNADIKNLEKEKSQSIITKSTLYILF